MKAAKGLIYEGEGGLRSGEEERIVVTADKAVESRKLGWRKAIRVPRRNVLVLSARQPLTSNPYTRKRAVLCNSRHQEEAARTLGTDFCRD